MYTIILAENPKEASRHAVEQGLKIGTWRYAVRASSIRGVKAAVIHELPGFAKRRDKHAINAELKRSAWKAYGSLERKVFHDESQRVTLEAALDLAYAANEQRKMHADYLESLNTLETEPDEPETLDTHGVPTRQRRFRCKTCGVLVWNDNDPEHDATMHAEAKLTPAGFFS